ncbi:rhomboid family intramembrane serine protease [Salinimicrobium oceani]|uniref:Rhomboid family intramembrane serine protease n=1 Tax=Salinimicrobium oceani TaxID=2722702 RepID=A0ABX1D0U5_9FLAO|nr:rhomboid family intramembrane serine protease [Salinimicrobium oceani]NJW53940.1 rhomboid family intramembrane serine protease [Salinimicrobium oceani]
MRIPSLRDHEQFVFTPGVVGFPILFVLLIWIVFWMEIRFGWDFTSFGVYPRKIEGLRGVLFSPFIHSDIKHLFHNTIPLFVLTMSLFYFYRKLSWKILFLGLLFSGILTWIIGRPAYHIGASGIVYVLASFLFFKGIFSKYYRLVALSLIVVFLYGGLLWYVAPIDPQISWEGHLSGLVAGLIFALVYKKDIATAPKYEWERSNYKEENDPFMRHFDENGNFVEDPDNNDLPQYIYHYRKAETDKEEESDKKDSL